MALSVEHLPCLALRRVTGLLAVCAAAIGPAAAANITITAQARGSAVAVEARAVVAASPAVVWATLTDYNRLGEFIPGMHSSRITERRGPTAIVAQEGAAGFFWFSYGIDVVVSSTEFPPDRIELSLLRGNLKRLEGRYRIARGEHPDAQLLHWSGVIEPALSLPAFIGVPLIRRNISEQFRGMVEEIERRDAQRRGVEPAERMP